MKGLDEFKYELHLDEVLRKRNWLIPCITIITSCILYTGIVICLYFFNLKHYWTVLPAGLMAHAFFIVLVHDGAHNSITRTSWDRVLMNLGAAVVLLPFYAEPFRKYHLLHHANTNNSADPLWPPVKKQLYEKARWFYIICECVPLVLTAYLITRKRERDTTNTNKLSTSGPRIQIANIIMASIVSGLLVYFFQPNIWFFLGTLCTLNIFAKIRHWCEHIGQRKDMESNTFWFPLGMGIGNHDTHHHAPYIGWLALMVGLLTRPKTTSVGKAIYGVTFEKSFAHFQKKET